MTLVQFSELRGRLTRFGEESPEHQRIAQDLLFGLENSYKVYFGAAVRAQRRRPARPEAGASEAALRARVPQLSLGGDFGDPWATIDKAQDDLAALYLPYRFVERGPIGSDLFGYARSLVRAAAERQKPSAERLPGYADSQLPLLEKEVLDAKPVEAAARAAAARILAVQVARISDRRQSLHEAAAGARQPRTPWRACSPPRNWATRRCARSCGTGAGRRCRPPTTR